MGCNMDLEKAKTILAGSNNTCVLCCGDRVLTTSQRGIKPLLEWLDIGNLPSGFSAADKAVGKAPAAIYTLMGAKAVYANIMSTAAIEIFDRFGIEHECGIEVPMIMNRAQTDFCPVELAVKDCSEPSEIVSAARKRLAEMN